MWCRNTLSRTFRLFNLSLYICHCTLVLNRWASEISQDYVSLFGSLAHIYKKLIYRVIITSWDWKVDYLLQYLCIIWDADETDHATIIIMQGSATSDNRKPLPGLVFNGEFPPPTFSREYAPDEVSCWTDVIRMHQKFRDITTNCFWCRVAIEMLGAQVPSS